MSGHGRIAIGLCWLLAAVLPLLAEASVKAAALDEAAILRQMAAAGVPGLAYAVVAQGQVQASGGLGRLERDGQAPVDADSRFLLGSAGKSLTALAVLQLVESGRLELDDPLGQHLPAWAGLAVGQPTIRQLLSHTSGWSTLQGNLQQDDLSLDASALARRAQRLAELQPAAAPGERWQYSNANYLLLGHLIEQLSGQSYGSYLEQKVLRPLGMHDTQAIGPASGPALGTAIGEPDSLDHSRLAAGHRFWLGWRTVEQTPLVGAGSAPQGGIITTAADMGRFLASMTNAQDDVLSVAGKRQMLQIAGGVATRYGFGWFIDVEQGRAFHAGASPGFESMIMLLPTQGRAAVVLLNAGSGFGFGETAELRQSVIAQLLQLPYAGERRPVARQAAYLGLLLLSPLSLLLAYATWRGSQRCRRRLSGALARLLLAAMLALLWLLPRLFGAPLSTISLYRPDVALLLAVNVAALSIWFLAGMVRRRRGV